MNGYNFTERVRKVLAMAREEAARLHHEYVGTEHILLGLIREGQGVAATVLQHLSVELDEIRQKIEETVRKGKAAQTTRRDLPYTSRAKTVLALEADPVLYGVACAGRARSCSLWREERERASSARLQIRIESAARYARSRFLASLGMTGLLTMTGRALVPAAGGTGVGHWGRRPPRSYRRR